MLIGRTERELIRIAKYEKRYFAGKVALGAKLDVSVNSAINIKPYFLRKISQLVRVVFIRRIDLKRKLGIFRRLIRYAYLNTPKDLSNCGKGKCYAAVKRKGDIAIGIFKSLFGRGYNRRPLCKSEIFFSSRDINAVRLKHIAELLDPLGA